MSRRRNPLLGRHIAEHVLGLLCTIRGRKRPSMIMRSATNAMAAEIAAAARSPTAWRVAAGSRRTSRRTASGQGRVRRSPCPGPWRLESDVPLHVRRARTHRRPARAPRDITSAPPATPLGARRASVTHGCPNARSRTRRNIRLLPPGVPPVLPTRYPVGDPGQSCSPRELRTAPTPIPREFCKRLCWCGFR